MDTANKKPLLRKNTSKGKIYAGFLNIDTGEFEVVDEFPSNDEKGIERFLDKYDLTVVMMSKID